MSLDPDERMVLLAPCIRCGVIFGSHPDTVPSVWVNTRTRCPVRPDATPITPGEPGTEREPLCETCAPIIRAAVGRQTPVAELFPLARLDLIERSAAGPAD